MQLQWKCDSRRMQRLREQSAIDIIS